MLDTFPVNSSSYLPLETLPGLSSSSHFDLGTDSLKRLPLAINSGAEVAYFNQKIQTATPQSQLTSNISARLVVDPGNTLNTAMGINIGTAPLTLSDSLSPTDTNDYYAFNLANAGNFRLNLNGLSANADVQLLNNTGGLIASSTNNNRTAENITQQLNAGNYYIRLYGTNTTNYNLTVGVDYAGDSLTSARLINVGPTANTLSDWVGSRSNITDTNDYYRFTLNNTSNFNLALNGLTGNADVQLLNGSNTVIASSTNGGTNSEAIARQLAAGNYSIRVYPRNSDSSYNLIVSATVPTPADSAGNTLATARVVTVGQSASTFSDWVGSLDTDDYYRFTLNNASNFNLNLSGLSANADVQLLDNNGVVLTTAANTGTTADSITRQLSNGAYSIRVYSNGGDTNYSLSLVAVDVGTGIDPGNTLATAEVLSSSIFSRNEQVSSQDTYDYYRFSVSQSGVFTANLTGLSGDADVRLIQDTNNNGAVDQGEILAWQWERGTASESIRSFLSSGNYFLAVNSFNNQTANYTVGTNFTAATSDSKDFRIQVNFDSTTLTGINANVLDGVQQAARFWENVISHSTFSGIHTLNINVTGQYDTGNWLASAGPTSWARDLNNRLLTTGGSSTLNTYYASYYNNNPNFLRDVMIHELGHILGIGTLWEIGGNSLINRTTATYNANTYAGQAYGELLNTYTPTAIPLTTGVGSGSDYAHWSEEVFDSELLTHQAETPGTPMPLSQMSIAALRDLGWQVNYGAAQPYTLAG